MLRLIEMTLTACQPEYLLRHVMPPISAGYKRVFIISIGKAAGPMAHAAKRIMKRRPCEIFYADCGHPLPTPEGVEKTKAILGLSGRLQENDFVLVLISGGGSAMLCAPVDEITLEDKITVTQSLLRCGASIHELNCVRTHLSKVKGGKLARALAPATMYGLIISDVVGNDPSVIASGPLSPPHTSSRTALTILKKYSIKGPRRVIDYLRSNKPHPTRAVKNCRTRIIADHATALRIAVKNAKSLNLKPHLIKALIEGEAREAAGLFISTIRRKTGISIAAGETTVSCRGTGCGGRNQEFALAALPLLPDNALLASIGTDGVDGICPEPIAGALVDNEVKKKTAEEKISVTRHLENNDSYRFFLNSNGLIKTGPTGTNLGDLVFYWRG